MNARTLFLVGLLVPILWLAGPARAEPIQYRFVAAPADSDTTVKWLNIGADPVRPTGFPADSLKAGWQFTAFDFPIWVRCIDAHHRTIDGWVKAFEPFVASVEDTTETEIIYRLHLIQRCGNPVLEGLVGVPIEYVPLPVTIIPPPPVTPTLEPAPTPAQPEPAPSKGGFRLPLDGWLGLAAAKSLESDALYGYEGVYIDAWVAKRVSLKFGLASSQANFTKNGGRLQVATLRGDMSRWQVGVAYEPWDAVKGHVLVGKQYDHKSDGWQPGWILEGWLGFPIWKIWNEENVSYQTNSFSLWYRSRHKYPVWQNGPRVWSVGVEGIYDSFRQPPFDDRFHTTRADGFVTYEWPLWRGLPAMVLFGIGRGSEHEAWYVTGEFGTRLF